MRDYFTCCEAYRRSPASVLTDITYPDGGHTQYTYKNGFIEGVSYTDASGQMTPLISDINYAPNSTMRSIRYGNGVVKNTERDANHNYRLTRATSTTIDGTKLLDTSYGYDAVSNITSISEGGIEPLRKSVGYSYDPLARLTSASYAYGVAGYGRDQSKNLSYTYDDIGNILTATDVGSYIYGATPLASPHAVTMAGDTSYSYDAAGHTILRVGPSDTLSFSYSPYGEMLSSTNGADVTSYSYDHTRRRIVKSTPGLLEHHVVDGYELEYESGALVFVPDTSPATLPSTSTGGVETPTIDTGAIDIGTGTTLTDTGSTSTGMIETGALVESTGSTSSGESIALPETTSTGVSASDMESTGSVLTGTITLADTGALDTSSTSTGEVLSASMSGDVSTGTYMVIASYTLASASGATPVDITTTLTHIYLGDERIATFQSQTDDTLRTTDDDRLIYHISDHLSSSSLDLSITGSLLQATDYLPFGKSNVYEVTTKRIKGKKGGYKNKYLFANKQLDEETDLQYFEKRYYDNRIGRFTTEDPVAWEAGLTKRPSQYFTDPEQWNTYSYVRNNPVNMVDPTGELLSYREPIVNDKYNQEAYIAPGRNLGPTEMFAHYIFGYGTSIGIPIDEVSLPEIKPEQFKAVNTIINNGKPGEYNIYTDKINPQKNSLFTIGTSTKSLSDRAGHGNIRLIIQGKLSINKDGEWKFAGSLKGAPDVYNFNQSSHRTQIGELSTTTGRNITGKSYNVIFIGSKTIIGQGKKNK